MSPGIRRERRGGSAPTCRSRNHSRSREWMGKGDHRAKRGDRLEAAHLARSRVILRCALLRASKDAKRPWPILRGSPKRLAPQDDVSCESPLALLNLLLNHAAEREQPLVDRGGHLTD